MSAPISTKTSTQESNQDQPRLPNAYCEPCDRDVDVVENAGKHSCANCANSISPGMGKESYLALKKRLALVNRVLWVSKIAFVVILGALILNAFQ